MILDKTMEVVKFTQNKGLSIQAKLFGVLSNDSGHLPSWMQDGAPFELKANFDQDGKLELELHFNDALNGKNCHAQVRNNEQFVD